LGVKREPELAWVDVTRAEMHRQDVALLNDGVDPAVTLARGAIATD
jgi:hypothetical protein